MLRLSQDIGPLSIGAFGYTGKEQLPILLVNDVWMVGPDLSLNLNERFLLNVQYVYRNDSQVSDLGLNVQNDVKTYGGFVEMIYAPKGDMSNWYLTGLINNIDSDDDFLDYTSATLHAGYIIRRNVRLVGEYTHEFRGNVHGRVSAGFISAF
jgi:hypothetical protein